MKRILFCLFSVAAIVAWCTQGFAFDGQTISGSTPTNLSGPGANTGVNGGVEMTNQGSGGTLDVGTQDIFTENESSPGIAISSTAPAVTTTVSSESNISFTGNSTVYGYIGGAQIFLNITDTSGTVNFLGAVNGTTTSVGTGTLEFNSGTSNSTATNFTGDGVISLGHNTTVIGALTTNTADTGTLDLASGSELNGAVGGATGLKAVTVVGSGVSATINGAVNAYQFNLGANTLNITGGAINIGNGTPSGVIDTTLASSSLYGQIVASGAATIATGLTINPNATGLSAGVGARFNIVDAASTPTGITPIVTNSGGYTFIALPTAANGLITIVTSGIPAATPGASPIVAPPTVLTLATLPTLDATASAVLAGIGTLTDQASINQADAQLGPSAPSLAAPQVTFQGAREFQDLWLSHLEMCSQAGSADEESTCKGTSPSNGVWVKGFGYFGNQDAKPAYNYAGYDSTIFGTMVAYDVPIIDENTRAGVGLGYAHTTIDGKTYETNSNIDFDTFQPTVYIGHDQGPWFIHGSGSFGYNQYSQQRGIAISGTNYVAAKSDYSGEDYTTFVNSGYNFSAPLKSTVTPIVSLQYSRVNMDSYTEKDAGDLDLHAKPQGYDFLESGLGAKVERDFSVHNWQFVPEIHAEWLHDFLNPTMGQTTEFMVGSAPLYTAGIKTDPDTLHAGTSLSLLSCTCSKTKLSLEAGYDFYWRNDGYSANQVTMRITGRF